MFILASAFETHADKNLACGDWLQLRRNVGGALVCRLGSIHGKSPYNACVLRAEMSDDGELLHFMLKSGRLFPQTASELAADLLAGEATSVWVSVLHVKPVVGHFCKFQKLEAQPDGDETCLLSEGFADALAEAVPGEAEVGGGGEAVAGTDVGASILSGFAALGEAAHVRASSQPRERGVEVETLAALAKKVLAKKLVNPDDVSESEEDSDCSADGIDDAKWGAVGEAVEPSTAGSSSGGPPIVAAVADEVSLSGMAASSSGAPAPPAPAASPEGASSIGAPAPPAPPAGPEGQS